MELSQPFLDSLGLNQDERVALENAIEDHPRLNNQVRVTPLAQLLQDADRLDGLSGYEPMRMGQGRWKAPTISNKEQTSTAEGSIVTVRQDLARVLEWEGMLWTDSARNIVAEDIFILRQLATVADRRAQLVYSPYDELGIQVTHF